jgi:TDG/mug DNA glycosylase family protein
MTGLEAPTLPDLLKPGLDLVFIGINPSLYSVAQGHYFARKANRFWPCLSTSLLSLKAREGLGVARLEPAHDRALLDYGFGFTDMAKRASARASDLSPAEFAAGVALLVEKLETFKPRIACFQGISTYRYFHEALTQTKTAPELGRQALRIGATEIFVIPNPSPANARFTPKDQTDWYDALAAHLAN